LISASAKFSFSQNTLLQAYKIKSLLDCIEHNYVSEVDINKLTESAIVKMLADLDPHSVYISAEEIKDMNEPLQGSFYGIGIQFNILKDSLYVVSTVPGGPSEKIGLQAGDRIVKVDNENIAGIGLKNSGVRKRLKGEKGTKVKLHIHRRNHKKLLEFVVTRDKIPIHSLDASYMIDDKTGYIKLNRFAITSYEEFTAAVKKLKSKGMKYLVFDLQGNGGGVMDAAIRIVDEFVDDNKLIVYTEGVTKEKNKYFSTSKGLLKDCNLIVLLDENSASASEIVAGGIQDLDRGIIVGRRSFGKGLVQRQFPLADGSVIRLTTSHYFTPSGRCIQKPYDKGVEAYRHEALNRYLSGELVNRDSIKFPDSLKFKTNKGRTVYGGGGVQPDVFVALDTTKNYSYMNQLLRKNILYPFVLDYYDNNRDRIKSIYSNFKDFEKNFKLDVGLLQNLYKAGEKEGIERPEKIEPYIVIALKMHIKSLLARDMWTMEEYYRISNYDNSALLKAIEIINSKKNFAKILSETDSYYMNKN
jgi:carboxyl-terminal processing protease